MRASTRKAVAVVAAALALAALPAVAHDQIPGAPQEAPVLLRGGDLYTVSGGVLPATDLLFEDGKITAIGQALEAPAGTEIVDVSGQRVYPGLIAPDTTLGLSEIGAVRATNDVDEVGTVNPEVVAHTAFNPDSELIPTVRTHGVTTVQVAPGGDLIRGRSSILHLDGWTKEDAAVVPVDGLFVTWPRVAVLDWWFMPPAAEQKKQMAKQREDLRKSFETARAYDRARGADAGTEIDLRWEAMRALWSDGMPVYVAAADYRQILEAVDFAEEFDLDLVLVGPADAYRLTDLLRERDIPVILDATTNLPYRNDSDYDAQFRQAARLHEAGVRFGIGLLDANWSVRSLALEGAGAAIAWGLPEDVALRAVTLSNAEILGIADREGSLEVGKDATLFVSRGDVTDTLGHDVTHMWIQGRPVSLDNRHRELYRKYAEKIRRLAAE
ncbi:MAG: amidohydrolase family protein [Thermoanaerobaculia bacterium]